MVCRSALAALCAHVSGSAGGPEEHSRRPNHAITEAVAALLERVAHEVCLLPVSHRTDPHPSPNPDPDPSLDLTRNLPLTRRVLSTKTCSSASTLLPTPPPPSSMSFAAA